MSNKMLYVEMEVMIEYKNRPACFRIHQESEGIFTAYLLSYTGNGTNSPAAEITLVKGVRNWAGSVEDDQLLRELGGFIETHWLKYLSSSTFF